MTQTQTSSLPRMSGARYVPKIGETITINLPDELTRGTIERVISDDAVIATLQHFTTARTSHNYRKGDLVPCRFEKLGMGIPGWRAVSDREMDDAAAAQAAKQTKAVKPAAKKTGKK